MVFIVKKKIGNREYYYLRESRRENGKVKAVTLAYLGKTRKEAEEKADEFRKRGKKLIGKSKERVDVNERKELISRDGKGIKMKMAGKTNLEKKEISVDELAAFCKRKGFVYPSGEIYGGFAGFWDFGHLGAELKKNLKGEWWKYHVYRNDIVGIDGSIITNPEVWKASGHVDSFSDIFVTCKNCKKPGKVDKNEINKAKCVNCFGDYDWDSAKEFKLMFKTDVGMKDFAYLRPETAQLIFSNFKFVQENARLQPPFGIAQIGKAFRNEIAPRDFLFRMREFEQMELEYFIEPGMKCPYKIGDTEILIYSAEMQESGKDAVKMKFKDAFKKGIIKKDWHAYWLEQEFLFFINLGADASRFRIRQHLKDEKSHYASDTWDLEYNFPFGWKELEGIADRGVFDLSQHEKFSGEKMEIVSDNKKVFPEVVCEPSLGVERALLVFLFDAYYYDSARQNIVLRLNAKLAPVKAAVFPIVKNPEYEKIALDIVNSLREWNVVYDKSGSVGRRYSRNDEIGTPMCITIDEQTPRDNSVTIRDRDTTSQVRVKIKELKEIVRAVINGASVLEFGKQVETRKK